MADTIHKFEQAGLGKPPYKFLYYERRPNGCNYCWTGIVENFVLESADGKRFHVGSDCIYKAGDAGLISIAKRELNKVRNEARHAREDERIAKAKELFKSETLKQYLKTSPHPYKYQADKGLTLLDFVQWMFANAGNKGMIEASKVVEKAQQVIETQSK